MNLTNIRVMGIKDTSKDILEEARHGPTYLGEFVPINASFREWGIGYSRIIYHFKTDLPIKKYEIADNLKTRVSEYFDINYKESIFQYEQTEIIIVSDGMGMDSNILNTNTTELVHYLELDPGQYYILLIAKD